MATRDIIYEPINTESKDIRLLRLFDRGVQGRPSSEIFHDRRVQGGPSCEIFHASLDDNVQYEALPYSWGDAQLQETIIVNGNPTSVTTNLARALEDIRFDVGTRILWVDALCIDQKNTKERNHQVKQMGAIYRKAEKVVAWVGRPNGENGRSQTSILDSWNEMEHRDQAQSYTDNPDLRAKWLSMASFCELPYWRRLWIVQEVGLASELWVYHGHSCQTWKQFSKLRKAAQKMKSSISTHGTLRGIATTISEGLPGRLDQQKEYRQPSWLRELHDTIQYLLSRAESAAKAAWILYGVFHEFKSWHELLDFEASSIFDGGANPQDSTLRTSIGIKSAYDYVIKVADLIENSYSEYELRLLPDEDSETPLVPDFEAQISIGPFRPLDTNLAEAFRSLPHYIRHVRKHEREEYEKELNITRYVIDNILVQASEDIRFPHLSTDSVTFCNYNSGTGHSSREHLIQLPRYLNEEETRLRTQIDKTKRTTEPIHQDSKHNNNKMQKVALELEIRSKEIEKLKKKIKYINDRYLEVKDYFEMWETLHRSLHKFSRGLATELGDHQPAFLLRTLLETCERSLCQNPRDKIYGLLGLASNVKDGDLEVDYSKSLFDLFWDVIWLTYKQERNHARSIAPLETYETELVRFSQLIQRSLGGPFSVVEGLIGCRADAESRPRPLVHFPGYIIGTILLLDLGDDLSESVLYKTRVEILKQYFKGQWSQIDMVVSVLDQLKDAKEDLLTPMTGIHAYGTTKVQDQYNPPQPITNPRKRKTRNSQPVLFVESSGLIGLAPCTVRSDDVLVQFSNCDIAAIIRSSVENEDEYMVVGRAVVARRFDEKRKTVSDSSPELFKYAVPDPQSLLVEKLVWFGLDAVTLQKLTCPVSEKREYNFDVLAV